MSIRDPVQMMSKEKHDKLRRFWPFRRKYEHKVLAKKGQGLITLPDSAVAGTTIGGHRYIAISIPVDHAHLNLLGRGASVEGDKSTGGRAGEAKDDPALGASDTRPLLGNADGEQDPAEGGGPSHINPAPASVGPLKSRTAAFPELTGTSRQASIPSDMAVTAASPGKMRPRSATTHSGSVYDRQSAGQHTSPRGRFARSDSAVTDSSEAICSDAATIDVASIDLNVVSGFDPEADADSFHTAEASHSPRTSFSQQLSVGSSENLDRDSSPTSNFSTPYHESTTQTTQTTASPEHDDGGRNQDHGESSGEPDISLLLLSLSLLTTCFERLNEGTNTLRTADFAELVEHVSRDLTGVTPAVIDEFAERRRHTVLGLSGMSGIGGGSCSHGLLFPGLAATAFGFGHGFDVREATIESLHDAIFTRSVTCRDIVSSFIARIEDINPIINAVTSLYPDALSVADALDDRIASGNVTGPLFCIPFLVKDNFDVAGMSTTGGSQALAHHVPSNQAPTIQALIDAGAVLLGKTNLHEMALEGLTVSSLGGQTLNPYDLTRTPGGSSGGSGAAVAANLAVFATGTDTMNSLRSPASANALVSFRPTRGLISRAGVMPVSFTQDAVGAMARTTQDLAVVLTVMTRGAGLDPRDNVTSACPPDVRERDYSASLHSGGLKGLRLGVLRGFFNHTASPETTPVNKVMGHIQSKLAAAGIEVVDITDPMYDALAIAKLDVQKFEFREMLDAYLATTTPATDSPHPTSFHDLYESGKFLVIPAQYEFIKRASRSSTADPAYRETLSKIQDLTRTLKSTFTQHRLDVIVYPEQKNLVVKLGAPSQAGRNGILAALTGYPVVCVPAGYSPPSTDAPMGVPIGMEILGMPWSEHRLLNIAQHIVNNIAPGRRMPPFANHTVEPREYAAVPDVKPDSGNVPAVYPLGVLG
ncbi:hypothetical protein VTJ49DRAFT_2093 [Mycothermus thermophilus]|uniref:Amidase domain-containing protein n=1 Tax=Humicola insolens TaxID=85995 RepID=A0ABR3VAL1_HUMIN